MSRARGGFQGRGVPSAPTVPAQMIKAARQSGQLNISGRRLDAIPMEVWRINLDAGEGQTVDLSGKGETWWEQSELTKLMAASNSISSIPDEVANLVCLTLLDLHDNAIVAVSPALAELPELKVLNLGHNQLSDIQLPPALQTLHLEHNRFERAPPSLVTLAYLERLDLSDNCLDELPRGMSALRALRSLKADNNKLLALPDEIGSLELLEELQLAHNRLQGTPATLAGLQRLQRLDLRYNQLTQPPQVSRTNLAEVSLGFNRLQTLGTMDWAPRNIKVLDVRDNKLRDLPPECALFKLERLDVTNNDLSSLPSGLGKCESLKALVVDGNPLRSIRRDIIARGTMALLKHLRNQLPEDTRDEGMSKEEMTDVARLAEYGNSIDFSGRRVQEIPQNIWEAADGSAVRRVLLARNLLTRMPPEIVEKFGGSVTHLDLGYNKLEQLDDSIGALSSLQVLDVRGCALASLPRGLAALTKLQDLVISLNRFDHIPEVVYALGALTTLIASDNQISQLNVAGLQRCAALTTLELTNNSIAEVPPELGLLPLKTLKLEGNLFRTPRPAVLAKGTPAVLEYLRGRIVQ